MSKKVLSMMRSMEFLPSMGLGKNQQGPPEFVEHETPRLKHGVGYNEEDNSEEELEIRISLRRRKRMKLKLRERLCGRPL